MAVGNQNNNYEEEKLTVLLQTAFIIRGENGFDPKLVSERLGIQPSNSWKKNDEFTTKMYDKRSQTVIETVRKRQLSVWKLDTKGISLPNIVESHLIYLLDILEPVQEKVAYYVNHTNEYAVGFFVLRESEGVHGGYTISNNIIRRINNLCQFISFSHVCNDGEDEIL